MPLDFVVCDEVQFYSIAQCDQLARVADDLDVDVYAFGLITDFKGLLFEGTKRMLEVANERVEMQVEARCWCGSRATHNARVVNGVVVYEGETVVVGDTSDVATPMFGDVVRYELLCRRHYVRGDMGEASTADLSVPSTRHALDAVDECTLQHRWFTSCAHVGHTSTDFIKHHRYFTSSQVGAEAEVRSAGTETNLWRC